MQTGEIILSTIIPAKPQEIYEAWLDSEQHSGFTGREANISPMVNSHYTAWDKYIAGKILELEPGKRILQTWRAGEFKDTHEDSMLEVSFMPHPDGTELKLKHWNIPEDLIDLYISGWEDYYFKPMKEYFSL